VILVVCLFCGYLGRFFSTISFSVRGSVLTLAKYAKIDRLDPHFPCKFHWVVSISQVDTDLIFPVLSSFTSSSPG